MTCRGTEQSAHWHSVPPAPDEGHLSKAFVVVDDCEISQDDYDKLTRSFSSIHHCQHVIRYNYLQQHRIITRVAWFIA